MLPWVLSQCFLEGVGVEYAGGLDELWYHIIIHIIVDAGQQDIRERPRLSQLVCLCRGDQLALPLRHGRQYYLSEIDYVAEDSIVPGRVGLFAILDGHGGADVSEYCAKHLPEVFQY